MVSQVNMAYDTVDKKKGTYYIFILNKKNIRT